MAHLGALFFLDLGPEWRKLCLLAIFRICIGHCMSMMSTRLWDLWGHQSRDKEGLYHYVMLKFWVRSLCLGSNTLVRFSTVLKNLAMENKTKQKSG